MGPVLTIILSLFIFYAGESACSAQDGCLAGGDTSSAKFVQTKLHTLQEGGVPAASPRRRVIDFDRRRGPTTWVRRRLARGVVATGEHAENCRAADRRRISSYRRRRDSTLDFCRCRRRNTGYCPPILVEGVPVNGGQTALVAIMRRRSSIPTGSFGWMCQGIMESSTIPSSWVTLQVTYHTGGSRRRNGRIFYSAKECGPSPAPTPEPTPVPTPPTAPFASCEEVADDPNNLCLIDGIGSGLNPLCGLSCSGRQLALIESDREGSDESGQEGSDKSDPELSDTPLNLYMGAVLRALTADGNRACNVHENTLTGEVMAQEEQCIESAMFAAMARYSDVDDTVRGGLIHAVNALDAWTRSMPLDQSQFPDYELGMGVCKHLLELVPFGGQKPLRPSETNWKLVHQVRGDEIYFPNCGQFSCVPYIDNNTLDLVATIYHPDDPDTNTWQECKWECDKEVDCYGFQMTCNMQCIHFHQACEVISVGMEADTNGDLLAAVEDHFTSTYTNYSDRCLLYPSYVMRRVLWRCWPGGTRAPDYCTEEVSLEDPNRLVGQSSCGYVDVNHSWRQQNPGRASARNRYRARQGPTARRRVRGDDLPCTPCERDGNCAVGEDCTSGCDSQSCVVAPRTRGSQLSWVQCLRTTPLSREEFTRQFWEGLVDQLRDPQAWLATTHTVVAGVDSVLNDGLSVLGIEMPFGISLGDILGCIPAFKGASMVAHTSRALSTVGGAISDVGSVVDLYTDFAPDVDGEGDAADGFALGTVPAAAGLTYVHQGEKTGFWSGTPKLHGTEMVRNTDPLTRNIRPMVQNPRAGKAIKVFERGIPCIGVLTKIVGAGKDAAESGTLPDGPNWHPGSRMWNLDD